MQISKEKVDELNAVLKLKVEPTDYQEKVENILKDYRKKANMPGFRPGMVPMGLIKKMYKKPIMAQEINKILVDSIYKYIEDEKLEILGNPLPKEEDQNNIDFDTQTDFEFRYELGLSPQFDVKVTEKEKFTKYTITVDEELLNKNITELAKRYGKVSETEISTESDMLQGEFLELDKEDGIKHTSTIAIEFVEDEKVKKSLVGLKVGDVVKVNPEKVSKGDADMAAMLGVTKDDLKTIGKNFQFTVAKIMQVKPAEINQDLFDKLFGQDQVKSVEEFRAKVADELKKALEIDSERKLKKDIIDTLQDKLKLSLPDDFLKRWLIATNEDKFSAEQVEKEYDDYSSTVKWQLIEGKIIKENDIKVTNEEVVEHTKGLLKKQFAMYGQEDIEEELVTNYANNVLKNKDEVRRIYDNLYDEKVMNLFKNKFTIKNKEVSFDEFVKLATGKVSKFNLFNKFKF